MYRALPSSRRSVQSSGRVLVRTSRRRLATEATESITPPPKSRTFRKILLTTTGLTATFYVGSSFLAFNNQQYYDIFSDRVPLGASMLDYAEAHHWDTITLEQAMNSPKDLYAWAQRVVEKVSNPRQALENAKQSAELKMKEAREAAQDKYKESRTRVQSVVTELKTDVQKEEGLIGKAGAIARHQEEQLSEAVLELVRKAEAALGKGSSDVATPSIPAVASGAEELVVEIDERTPEVDPHVYNAPLPVGFEPPPGFSRPAPPKKPTPPTTEEPARPPLPLVAPAVAQFSASEPIIAQLASNIDNLASFLNANPSAASKATDILTTAQVDLTALAERIDKAREEERVQLEQKLDEQSREYSLKLLELEMTAQDKLDSQENDFRHFFDEERQKILQAYREKLDHELRTQTELINERLKEEVIAQGIEMQRRWIREIKVRVEQERGGRLSKLDELSTELKRLERIALDNNTYLDENIRVHALWSALRSLDNVVEAPARQPFREELRTLRHLANAAPDGDAVVTSALETLEATDVPDIGVEPFADLATWFSSSVAPKVSTVALVPDQDAGVLSHLASHLFSTFQFKRHGLVEGSDVLSVLSRAEYYLNEKDLDGAARELNQLRGTAGFMVKDWLEAARRRLEVMQALEVIKTQATLSSILII